MAERTLRASFDGGELAPELLGRIDLEKYASGLKTCRNFITRPHGPAVNRAGMEFIVEVKDSSKATRLLPFIFSPSQAYIMEFGDQYVRFHTEGATVLEATQNVTGATSANPVVLTVAGHGYSNGDDVYADSLPGDFAELNGRFLKAANVTTNTFELTDALGVDIDGSGFAAYTSGGTAARPLETATPYLEADLFDLVIAQAADTVTITHPSYAPRELVRVSATSWTLSTVTFAPGIDPPANVTATATSGSGSDTHDYVVTAVSESGLEESLASTSDSCTNDLSTSGNYNTVTGDAVSGAVRYNVYKARSGIYGYVGQTDDITVGFIDDNISPDMLSTPPINRDPFTSADNYPGAVTYYAQRRIFAGTNNQPQNKWMSRPGAPANLSYSIPFKDDDSITFALDSRQVNRILHLVPMTDLLDLTNTGEWKITSQNSDTITPTTVAARQQGYTGASSRPPLVAGSNVLYVRAQGSHVSELKYALQSNAYDSSDVSIYAPHFFDGYTIDDWTFQRAPQPMVWAVRNDGVLLAMTYMPEQAVQAWHQHDTLDGLFESVCAIPESTNEDMVYAVIKRTVDGNTRRYIERLHVRRFSTVEDAFFVDSGLTYDGSATDTLSGLHHLDGETVVALADGNVVRDLTVAGGSVTLPSEASVVHIGLPITADLETLPVTLQADALAQGTVKSINRLYMRVEKSRGIFAGYDTDNLTELAPRTSEPWGAPTSLRTEEVDLTILGDWNQDGSVTVRQSDPLPLSLLSVTMEVAVGD